MEPRLAFFGDLHLSNRKQDLARDVFCQTLEKLAEDSYTHIIFLGDIFDLLIGPKSFWKKRHAQFFDCLNKLNEKNISIVWVEGNHDFHFKKLFANYSNLKIVEEDYDLIIGNFKLFLSHGDKVNRSDLSYLRCRRITKSKLFRGFLNLIPSFLGELAVLPLAEKASKSSRKRSRESISSELKKLYLDFARQKISENYTGVVLGHNHSFTFENIGENAFYLNLGAPSENSLSYATWNPKIEAKPIIQKIDF